MVFMFGVSVILNDVGGRYGQKKRKELTEWNRIHRLLGKISLQPFHVALLNSFLVYVLSRKFKRIINNP